MTAGTPDPPTGFDSCQIRPIFLRCQFKCEDSAAVLCGYTLGPHRDCKDGHWYSGASPSKKSVQRIKTKIGDLLRPGHNRAWPKVRDRLNRLLASWSACFGYVPAGRPIGPSIIMSMIASCASSLGGTKCKGAVPTLGLDYFWTPIMVYFSAPIDTVPDGSPMRKSSGGSACSGSNACKLDRHDPPSWSLSTEPHISPLGNKPPGW